MEVNLVSWYKSDWEGSCILDGQKVNQISSRLDTESEDKPVVLRANENKAFIGSYVLGLGFTMEPQQAAKLIQKDKRYSECLVPYLNGEDLNSNLYQEPSRWIINFYDWPMEQAAKYSDCFAIIRDRVKPERDKNKRKAYRDRWWQYGEKRPKLYTIIEPLKRVLVRSAVSENHSMAFVPNGIVYAHRLIVFAYDDDFPFAVLQSSIHDAWGRKYSSTLESRQNYSPSDCFDTFPFPQSPSPAAKERASKVGGEYHEHRRQLMLARQEGLTKTYNRLHSPAETSEDIARLRALHAELDAAILACYGWADLDPGHGFHQNERGQTRYTVSDAARREILARLLRLNLEVAAEEANHKDTKGPKG